jgi:hypothetical protein
LFCIFGAQSDFAYTLTILGGTLLELMASSSVRSGFLRTFFFGAYLADARALSLPLVGSGDHDWEILCTQWNLLLHDVQIGHTARILGWLGMFSAAAWFSYRAFHSAD